MQRKAGRIKRRGRSRFPKLRDPKLIKFVLTGPCLVRFMASNRTDCSGYIEPAHIKTRGAAGPDRDNVLPLCHKHHAEQEGRTKKFEAKYKLNLRELAVYVTAQYEKHGGEGFDGFPAPLDDDSGW